MVEGSGIAAPAAWWGARGSATYYSRGMAALPPGSGRRRPRRGTLERPVSGRLYRGTWLLVGIPLLAAAFSVHKPNPLPAPQPALPASFDGTEAVALTSELARLYPDRVPGTAGAVGARAGKTGAVRPEGRPRSLPCRPPRARDPDAGEPARRRSRALAGRDRRDVVPRR